MKKQNLNVFYTHTLSHLNVAHHFRGRAQLALAPLQGQDHVGVAGQDVAGGGAGDEAYEFCCSGRQVSTQHQLWCSGNRGRRVSRISTSLCKQAPEDGRVGGDAGNAGA